MTEPDGTGDELELVYPFVVCQSEGGPYEDVAFAAGVRFGSLRQHLFAKPEKLWYVVDEASVPQADLLAMHEGYAFTAHVLGDGWVALDFERVS